MDQVTAQVERTIDATPAEVWDALTQPEKLKQFFFGADVDSDFEVGSPIRMSGEFNGKPYQDKGEILAANPQHELRFSHWSAMSGEPDAPENYHVVTFTLAPHGKHTNVTLSQSNLKGGAKRSDVEHRAEYEKNWTKVLEGLAGLFH
jgi:uncharacterized protein YndB with AHSA1/START domain